jgi:uncharacterized protein
MKKSLCPVVLLLLSLVVTACAGGEAGGRRFLSLGTGGTGGVYYPLGGALASRLSLGDATRTWTAEVTGGSVENINRVLQGEMDLGFAIGPSVHEAWSAGGERLRVVAPLYPNHTHVLLSARGRVPDIAALRGRRVSVGSGGSGTELVARDVLLAAGLDTTAYVARYLSFSESAAALADGAIDGAIFSVGIPASAVLEAVTTGAARLVPMDAALISAMTAAQPYYRAAQIPAGTYPRQDEAIGTVAVFNWIVARDDLADDVVAAVLDLLRDERDALRRSVDVAGQIDLERLRDAPIPLHAAAAAWLEANGGR